MKTIENCEFTGQKVLVRVDFNVPLNHNRQITDDTRIRESLPTIKKILEGGGSVILMSHLGRPKGTYEQDYSLSPILPHLSKLLHTNVKFAGTATGEKTKEIADTLKPGEVLLLENLRFHPEEESGDLKFAEELSKLGDIYVNDAFATAHRDHASTSKVARFFNGRKFFGLLMTNELKSLEKVLNYPQPPFTAIIGGAKVSSKIDIIKNLLNRVDNMIIGGGMAFTFIKALGGNVGGSLIEEDKIEVAKDIVKEMMLKGVNLYLPVDAVIADSFSNEAKIDKAEVNNIPEKWMGLDIGKRSSRRFAEIITKSSTILWNGPMGVFEMPNFKQGTKSVAIAVSSATISGSFSLIGGGDSVA
ncbi:MAG: phosphoglycerate kinase, partial [Bacteroidales bacterium]|nr:phosphoglycerate kinase [Bacteroidales bacterium]